MNFNNLNGANIIIYRNHYPIATCTSVYLGFMSLFLKDIALKCPVGTPLEIEFVDDNFSYINVERIPMVINGSGTIGTSLKLKDDDGKKITIWKDILFRIKHQIIKKH